VPYDPDINLEGLRATRDGVGLFGRHGGLTACWVLEGVGNGRSVRSATGLHRLVLPEPASQVGPAPSRDFDSAELRLSYSSLVPGYDSFAYACARLSAPARDGTPIPLSLVYRKGGYDPAAGGPLMLYGYGRCEWGDHGARGRV